MYCSENEISFFFLIAYWPSRAAVTEKDLNNSVCLNIKLFLIHKNKWFSIYIATAAMALIFYRRDRTFGSP
jgi:hypothetical protein